MSRCLFFFDPVWTTQFWLPLLTEEREEAVYRLVMATARGFGAEVQAVNGMPDRIHLLVKTGASADMPHITKQIKGETSAMLNRLMQPAERFRWQGGYYSATVTPAHAAGTTHAFWEQDRGSRRKRPSEGS